MTEDYKKLQEIYLKWHDGHRPLSGFIKEYEQLLRDARLTSFKDALYLTGYGFPPFGKLDSVEQRLAELTPANVNETPNSVDNGGEDVN